MKMRTKMFTGKVFDASVDWLTATATVKDTRDRLWTLGERILHRAQDEGERPTRWHSHGYSGRGYSHCTLGAREDGVCLRLSSHEAANNWQHAVSAADNVSRLDLAVDCESHPPVTTLAQQIYHDTGHTPPENGRPPSRALIVNGDGGRTAYVGARSSESFGRVYDKGRERKTLPAGRWWRWEVEYKGDKAWPIAEQLRQIDDPSVAICATVATWFRRRTSNTFTSSTFSGTLVGRRCIPSDDVRLSWLARGVRPTVQTLVERVGLERVLFALGISPQSVVEMLKLSRTLTGDDSASNR
jgi:DNA relaxase NicK